MRMFFVIAPGALAATLCFISVPVGMVLAAATIWIGWRVTEPHPERGETR